MEDILKDLGTKLDYLIEEILETTYGDANLDSVFDSSDLVAVFIAAEYEDEIDGNSSWREGDWNGDGEFDTSDFVFAFQSGGFEKGPRIAANAVSEPNSLVAVLCSLAGLLCFRTRCCTVSS